MFTSKDGFPTRLAPPSTPATVIEILAEPDKAFAARKLTLKVPVSLAIGVQLKVPVVFPEPGVNTAWFPAGSPVRSALRDVMASPSGSEAVTFTVMALPAVPLTEAGAVTTGARSTLFTVIRVLVDPESAFEAVKVTV